MLDPNWFTSDFARHHFARGKEEGFNESKKEHLETLRGLVAELLRLKLSPAQAERAKLPDQIQEPSKLTKLILELTRTNDEAQVLAAMDRALTR